MRDRYEVGHSLLSWNSQGNVTILFSVNHQQNLFECSFFYFLIKYVIVHLHGEGIDTQDIGDHIIHHTHYMIVTSKTLANLGNLISYFLLSF